MQVIYGEMQKWTFTISPSFRILNGIMFLLVLYLDYLPFFFVLWQIVYVCVRCVCVHGCLACGGACVCVFKGVSDAWGEIRQIKGSDEVWIFSILTAVD